jgi:DNA repair protein RadC
MDIPNKLTEIQVRYTQRISVKERVKISGSADVFKTLWAIWDKDLIAYQEAFVILLLNRANRVMGYRFISFGGLSGTVVDVKHIFGVALKCNANSVILAHNHPSGNRQPSQADLTITRKIKNGGELLDINILDHLIITPEKTYYSFADEGVL